MVDAGQSEQASIVGGHQRCQFLNGLVEVEEQCAFAFVGHHARSGFCVIPELLVPLYMACERARGLQAVLPFGPIEARAKLHDAEIFHIQRAAIRNAESRIFIYPGMSHVKAAVFDGWACMGSANWDRWSLQINKEMNISTSDEAAVAALNEQLFDRDFAVSLELTEPLPVKWQDHLVEKFGDYFF